MKRVTDERLIKIAFHEFQKAVSKLSTTPGGYDSALAEALVGVQKVYPNVVRLAIDDEGDDKTFQVFEKG